VHLVGIASLVAGLVILSSSPGVGFDLGGALAGIASQLPLTLRPALAILFATGMQLLAGTTLVRLVRGAPFDSVAEAAITGLAGAIALDLVLLAALGPFGLFLPLPIALAHIGLGVVGLLLVRPWFAPGVPGPAQIDLPGALLVVAAWVAPLMLQLASPVPPGVDVLPNHVAPVEHLSTTATWGSLVVSPSPIYGPSRIWLGYVALLGSLAQLTSLSGALAVSAFTLPLTLLFAAAARGLAATLAGGWTGLGPAREGVPRPGAGGRSAAAFWVLLVMPLTFGFLRLPDARASVLASVLVAATLVVLVGDGRWSGRSQAVVLAACIATTISVHPPTGAFLALTVVGIGLASPRRARLAFAACLGAAVMALPQAAAMAGVVAPAWPALAAWLVGGLVAAAVGGSAGRGGEVQPTAPGPDIGLSTIVLVILVIAVAAGALVVAVAGRPDVADAMVASTAASLGDWWPLVVLVALAALVVRSVTAWLVIGVALLVGFAAVVVAGVLERAAVDDQLLAGSVAYEVPKAVGYWSPWFAAIAGGLGLAALWQRDAPRRLRAVVSIGVIVVVTLSLRPGQVEPAKIAYHPVSESLAISLQEAEDGYWIGYPDSRAIVDAPRQALLDAVRAEQRSGRIGPSTPVLHVAPSFQQWEATPLGVFDGVIETDATEDPEVSIHTVGGRLEDIADLPELLGPSYPWLVIEGYPDDAGYLAEALAAGYREVWRNERAVLLTR
jgi:hypothetical protein